MATITFTVTTGFLTRGRNALLVEHPELQGQTTAELNEALRQKFKELIKLYVVGQENRAAMRAAEASNVPPSDTDIN